jgi:hypothetical protein
LLKYNDLSFLIRALNSLSSNALNFSMDVELLLDGNELCDSVSFCEMTEFSSSRLSKNVQSYLSTLDVVAWNKESM